MMDALEKRCVMNALIYTFTEKGTRIFPTPSPSLGSCTEQLIDVLDFKIYRAMNVDVLVLGWAG
jgi:hypothetical protein